MSTEPSPSKQHTAFLVVPQVERRHRLIEELRATRARSLTGRTLAERLGVSVRTVERDLRELIEAGVPILIRYGPGGGYRLDVMRLPAPVPLTAGEIAALIVSVVAIGPYSSASARSALDKLLAAITPGT